MADETIRRSWQIPKFGVASKKEIHEFFKQQINDGYEYQKSSPGYEQLEESIRILSGKPTDELAEKQRKHKYSKAQTNRLKRNIREMVNSLSEIRWNPAYHSNSRDSFDTAETMNGVGEFWFYDTFVDLQLKECLKWASITPCGWLEICQREVPGGHGEAITDLIPMSWFDVVMTGVPDNGRFQEAYTVTIIKDLPMFLAHALWPDFQKELKPDRETPRGWVERIKQKAQDVIHDVFSSEPEKSTAKNPTVRLYYQFVLDLSINKSGKTMKMGYEKRKEKIAEGVEREVDHKMPWSYDVPSVGEMIPAGYDERGEHTYKPATPKQCRIFPGRRLLVGTDKEIVYDGPQWDWHGKVPLVKICADPWPFAEFSMVHDAAPIHEVINKIDRITDQTIDNRFNPTLLYNSRAIGPDKAKTVRADVQGQRIGYNGQEVGSQGAMSTLFDKAFNVVDSFVPDFRTYLSGEMDYQMGVRDIAALSKMKLGGSSDSMEKAMEMAGPIVKGISRDMERAMRELADMFKYYVFQYWTTPLLLQIMGPDRIVPVNFDYQPGNLIPSHLPGEYRDKPSIYSDMQRARWMADHVKWTMQPGTLHEIVQTTHKLMIMNAWQKGAPISFRKMNEVLRLGLNLGSPPEGVTNDFEQWVWEKKQMIEIQKEMEGESSNTPNLGPKGGPKGTGGRATTAQKSPSQYTKGDGRSGIKES
jgi:hypothetical protein